MADTIEENASLILEIMVKHPTDEMGRVQLGAEQLKKLTGLEPSQINDAISILERAGMLSLLKAMGTAPYTFAQVELTPLGKYEYQQSVKVENQPTSEQSSASRIVKQPTPLGSPFGFTDLHWEFVSESKSKTNVLNIVMGFQFKSKYYDSEKLKENVKSMVQKAVEEYNKLPDAIQVSLNFVPLAAGYGEHLFNEIARNIISSDIAIFDTSDLNPNVMIEMGVALTWGVRVLPIKEKSCPSPPSDISGQTWANYEDSASKFTDAEHHDKLVTMVERAARKKSS